MSSKSLISWSGLALVLGGALLALFVLVHPQTEFTPEVMSRGIAKLAHNFHFAGAALVAFGLIGLHLRQMESAGRLGLLGFILAFFGTVWFAGLGLMSFMALPFIAAHAPDLLAKEGPFWSEPPSPLFLAGLVCFVLGYILLGIAAFRGKVGARWSGLLFIPGALLSIIPPVVVPVPVLTVGGVLFGVGVAWMGYSLWSQPEAQTAQSSR